jgi:hypothetical protein
MNSPFSDLIGLLREEGKFYNEPSFYFAKVTSELPNLKVMLNDMELGRSNLLIDSLLLNTNSLNIGDKVVMLRDNNKFIIISKVVSI